MFCHNFRWFYTQLTLIDYESCCIDDSLSKTLFQMSVYGVVLHLLHVEIGTSTGRTQRLVISILFSTFPLLPGPSGLLARSVYYILK